jgi:hypothetical protein
VSTPRSLQRSSRSGQLCALADYAQWNPFITSAAGDLVTGARLRIRIAPPGGRPMSFRPTVTEVVAAERLEWLGRLVLPGVFDGRHSFTLESIGEGRTRLTQAEEFSGVLVALPGPLLERTRAGFEAMNTALRLRLEAASTNASPGGGGDDAAAPQG